MPDIQKSGAIPSVQRTAESFDLNKVYMQILGYSSGADDVYYLPVILLWFSTFRGATRVIQVKLQVSNKSTHTLNVFIVPLCILWLFPWCIVDQLTYNTLCSPEKTSPRKTLCTRCCQHQQAPLNAMQHRELLQEIKQGI